MKRGDLTRDELVLALDLYFQYRDDGLHGDAATRQLAEELDREYGAIDVVVRAYAWDDPKRPWRQASVPGEEARRVWQEFKDERAVLKKKVAALRKPAPAAK
jgi:hypothetical protein